MNPKKFIEKKKIIIAHITTCVCLFILILSVNYDLNISDFMSFYIHVGIFNYESCYMISGFANVIVGILLSSNISFMIFRYCGYSFSQKNCDITFAA